MMVVMRVGGTLRSGKIVRKGKKGTTTGIGNSRREAIEMEKVVKEMGRERDVKESAS